MPETRPEHDSMGELAVPVNALHGNSTHRAVGNFPISGETMDSSANHAYGLIKEASAQANTTLRDPPAHPTSPRRPPVCPC